MPNLGILICWILSAVGVLFFCFIPINLATQLSLGISVLVLVAVLKHFRIGGPWRLVVVGLCSAVVLRYVYWRTTQTIPPVSQLQNFIPGILLYMAELYSVMMLALSVFVVSLPRTSPDSIDLAEEDMPSVDVFIPSYNEDANLLANTIAAAVNMDYPADKLAIWLLDDGGTDQKCGSSDLLESRRATERRATLKALCADFGINYLTRARNEHAKAGNLNNGLAHSKGELIAVFDADHAPARNFLTQTVGYFVQNRKLFLVQTPHFFINPDPVERNLRTFNQMPSENEMFYGMIQRGLDKWNAAFFCGSAALLSREALSTTDGFSGVSITEDCETAVNLHAQGWESVYIDRPLIAGLQPATFASFIGQRSRWAQGMMQILRYRFPPFLPGLALPQRLCYMSSTLFWLFPFARMTFLVAPLFYLFFDLQIFVASGGEFLAYTLIYLFINLLLQNYLYGNYRWPWISELYEYVQSVHLFPAIISVLLNPKKPTFNVTAKDESITVSRLSEISRPFFIIFIVLVIALLYAAYRVYTEPYKADVLIVVGGWTLLNLIMAGCALGVVSERGEWSSTVRVKVTRRSSLLINGEWNTATIDDVSVNGMHLTVYATDAKALSVGQRTSARFQTLATMDSDELPIEVRNVKLEGDLLSVGCLFKPTTADHHRLVADLIFANSERWKEIQQERRTNPGVLRATLWFLSLSIYQTGRGLAYFLGLNQYSKSSRAKAQAKKVGKA
ncbi:UDP-forming cellulose synthase catalytic subunit [Brucella pseudogrignonensis]|uniref:UDP-forming cellulose synthase catalytic subunit n=1 Tax=Brucella pseudogrignonensis TaxID=419475 RepID=UPI0028BBEAE0|nr:UDP-forming cellulose synthase catalytic subunit [Brucella pseudogrignonensis]MDT6942120.1 UDP-forming cellulose synthase catalytic subunit [Brucella pseudogrignonensis]